MNTLTPTDLKALAAQDDATLAAGWCELNKWGWPAWLPDPVPEMQRMSQGRDHSGRGWAAMGWISTRLGLKRCNREWNKDRMTDEEFEDYWRGMHEDDHEAWVRHSARIDARKP